MGTITAAETTPVLFIKPTLGAGTDKAKARLIDKAKEIRNRVSVDAFEVADPADSWKKAGFSVDSDSVCRVGGVRIRLVGRDTGAAPAATLDTGAAPAATLDTGAGIIGWSLRGLPSDGSFDDLDGVPTTRSDADTALPATHANGVTAIDQVWGITYVVADIDATASFFGDRTAAVKDAVQPGRRITTLRHHDLGLSVRTALISARR